MGLKDLSLRDLAITISDYLMKNGVNAVLTGGACVAIYTKNRFVSEDIDFVLRTDRNPSEIIEILEKIGFYRENNYFRNKDIRYTIEFPAGPLSVGNQPIARVDELKEAGKTATLLSAADCVKDRLAHFFYFNDRQCLEQAVSVYKGNQVDIKEIERWARKEGEIEKFKKFADKLEEPT